MHEGFPLTLLPGLLVFAAYVFHGSPRPARGQTPSPRCCTQSDAPAPREFDFPHYSLRDGFSSKLQLVNIATTPIDLTIAIHSLSGQTILAPVLTMPALDRRSLDIGTLLAQLSADVTGTFAEGSISIYFTGLVMPIAGQLTMTNPIQRMSFETEMVDNSPGLYLLPKQLNALWWGLGGGRDARIIVTNTAPAGASADVYLDFQGQRHTSTTLTFVGHETKVLSISQLLGDLRVSPAQAPEGGITIVPRDLTPTLLAQGRITDSVTGFSATLNFPDPAFERTNVVHASGVPIGKPSANSPYVGAGTFVPHVMVRNLVGTPQIVTISVEYPQTDAGGTPSASTSSAGVPTDPKIRVIPAPPVPGDANDHPEWGPGSAAATNTVTLAPLPVGGYSTVDYPLELGQLPAVIPHASIRIQYSGSPGSAIAEVASVEAKGDLVVDGHVDNEGNFWAGAGAHPWHLDEQTESTLFLTNMSDQTVRMGFRVDVSGSSYFLTKLSLGPHETRSINIRKLRDAQKPDFKGNLIPAGASDGSVSWVHLQKIPVMGRLVVLRRKQGLASSYQCGACPCPSYAGLSMTPSPSYYLAVNSSYGYAATAEYTTCTAPYYTDMTDSATWTSDNTPVATVSTGMVTAVSGGTANIKASYTGVTFVAEFSECEPTGQATYNPTCPTTVPSGTITINLGPPPSTRSSSFSAGDGLSFAGFVSCGNILGAVGCGSGWFWQVEVVGTVSDNAANWAVTQDTNTETTTITLTNLTQNTTVSGYSHDNPNPGLVQTSNGTTKVYWLDSPGPFFNSNIYSINDQATKTSRICSTETSTTDCVCVDWNYQLVGTANLTRTAGIINTTSSSAAITRTSYICQTQR